MRMLYQDAMGIVRAVGLPDLFLTFTCNPSWQSITNALNGQSAAERPDIVNRVFRHKLDCLLRDLRDGHHFGRCVALIHVVEFQKRGLPHAHILLTLDAADKPRTASDIDRFVSAEIPDKDKFPELHRLVAAHMIHNGHATTRGDPKCFKDGRCSKNFPKAFAEQSRVDASGSTIYKRPDNGRKIDGTDFDNRWVVPYSPALLLRYQAHINVEVCNGSRAVKYLYKYIYKGGDMGTAEVIVQDEVKKCDNSFSLAISLLQLH